MQTIILCEENKSFLEPITNKNPLELTTICGRKIIDYMIINLLANEIEKAVVVSSEQSLIDYIEGMSDSEIELRAKKINKNDSLDSIIKLIWDKTSDILVIKQNGIEKLNLTDFIDFYKAKKADGCVYSYKGEMSEKSLCVTFNEAGLLEHFVKNPSNEFCSTHFLSNGVYILSSSLLKSTKEENEIDLSKSKGIFVYKDENPKIYEIDDKESFLSTAKTMITDKSFLKLGIELSTGIYSNTPLNFSGVTIKQPVYIGKDVQIGMGSVIEKGSVIENHVIIGDNVSVKGSYVGEYTKIHSGAKLTNAIVMTNTEIFEGVECKDMSVIGSGTIIEKDSIINENIKVWSDKKVPCNTNLHTNLKTGNKFDFALNEDANDKITSPIQCVNIGCAVGSSINDGESVVIGYKKGEDTKAYALAVASGIVSAGKNVWMCGECEECTTDFLSGVLSSSMFIFVKSDVYPMLIMKQTGGVHLKRDIETEIERRVRGHLYKSWSGEKVGKINFLGHINELYFQSISEILPKSFEGINVSIKTSSEYLAKVCDRLFLKRNDLNGEEIIFHILNENGKISAYTDETGYVFYEKLVFLVAANHLKNGEDIALPFTFPSVIEEYAQKCTGKVYRYYNSSCSNSDTKARLIAKRENNRFQYDPLYLICDVLSLLNKENITLAEALKMIPEFYTSEKYIYYNEDNSKGNLKNMLDTVLKGRKKSDEGIVVEDEGSRAILRPLKKGKGLMLFVDSNNAEIAKSLSDDIIKRLNEFKR